MSLFPKLTTSFLYIIFLFASLTTQAKGVSEREAMQLKGKVKSIVVTDYSNLPQSWGCILRGAKTYVRTSHDTDANGNQTVCYYYDNADHLVEQKLNKFDVQNRLIATATINAEGICVYQQHYCYGDSGLLLFILHYGGQDTISSMLDYRVKYQRGKQKYIFDTTGKVLERGYYDDSGLYNVHEPQVEFHPERTASPNRPIVVYDSLKRPLCQTVFNRNGSIKGHLFFKYNKFGAEQEVDFVNDSDRSVVVTKLNGYDSLQNLLTVKMQNIDGTPGNRWEYTYDENRRKVSFKVFHWDNVYKLKRETWYNEWGSEIGVISNDDNGKFNSRSIMEYDSLENLTRTRIYDADNTLEHEYIRHCADFDSHGNWRKQVSWDDYSFEMTTTYRTIEYY